MMEDEGQCKRAFEMYGEGKVGVIYALHTVMFYAQGNNLNDTEHGTLNDLIG